MLEILLILIGVVGFAYVGYKDLKTTEFPDWVPYAMIIGSLAIKFTDSFLINDFSIFTGSLINGLLLLGIGLILYFCGSWADGDAYAMGAMGFLFPLKITFLAPTYFLPLPLMLISNVFAIGGFYMILYAIILGVRNLWVMKYLRKDLADNGKKLIAVIAAIVVVAFGAFYLISNQLGVKSTSSLLTIPMSFVFYAVFMLILWRYVKVIDQKIFVKRVKASGLRYGDIPVNSKLIKMPDPAMIRKLRAKGGYVKIKEGVRFTPVFLIALIFTLVYGDAIYWILSHIA